MQTTYVLYHAGCFDGAAAAYAAFKALGAQGVEYLPVSYSNPPPEMAEGSCVYIVDFSYKRATMLSLLERYSVVCLDHHKTAQDDLAGLPGCVFDMSKSGCVLAWEYFHPSTPVPLLLQYRQDRDLWMHRLEATHEVNAYTGDVLPILPTTPEDFQAWEDMVQTLATTSGFEDVAKMGKASLRAREALAKRQAVQTYKQVWDSWLVAVVNCTAVISDTCHLLLDMYPDVNIIAAFRYNRRGEKEYSLRSRDGEAQILAQQFPGGGGHPNSAGFTLPVGVEECNYLYYMSSDIPDDVD